MMHGYDHSISDRTILRQSRDSHVQNCNARLIRIRYHKPNPKANPNPHYVFSLLTLSSLEKALNKSFKQ